MVNEFKFFQKNKFKDKCRLEIGSTFIFHGQYCIVTAMKYYHFTYIVQETQRTCHMHYDYYLQTPSAAGRQLNRI